MNNQNIENIEDEISLTEIIDFFRESWKQIVLGGVVGGVIGVSVALIMPSIYQATVGIEMAKVADKEVEPANTLLEKLKMPLYYSSETFMDCGVDKSAEPGIEIVKNLKPTIAKSAPILNLSIKAGSSDKAKKCLESLVNNIKKTQNEIAKPLFEHKKIMLLDLKNDLELVENLIKGSARKKQNFDVSDSDLLIAAMLSSNFEFLRLRKQINDLEMALAEPQTKEAFTITPVYSPGIRVEPKRSLIVIGSVIGGVVLVIGFLIARRRWAASP